jgi:hypothetical protein
MRVVGGQDAGIAKLTSDNLSHLKDEITSMLADPKDLAKKIGLFNELTAQQTAVKRASQLDVDLNKQHANG